MIGLKRNLRHPLIQSEVKAKAIVTRSHAFSRASRLCVSYVWFLRDLIGSLHCLCPLWLARVKTVVLVARWLIKNRSISFHKLPSTLYTQIKFDFRLLFLLYLKESFPTVWHMKNMLESFKKDHQVREWYSNTVTSNRGQWKQCQWGSCLAGRQVI